MRIGAERPTGLYADDRAPFPLHERRWRVFHVLHVDALFDYSITAEQWLSGQIGAAQEILAEMEEGKTYLSGCPFRVIREVKEGKELFVGTVVMERSRYLEVEDREEAARLALENEQKEDGDPSIVYTFGGEIQTMVCVQGGILT